MSKKQFRLPGISAESDTAIPMTAIPRKTVSDMPTMLIPTTQKKPPSSNWTTLEKLATIPMQKRHVSYRHVPFVVVCQLFYFIVAVLLCALAYFYLAAWPVYRIVASVVIVITWSNFAGRVALKKSIDMLATVRVQAIRIGARKKASHTDETDVFLQSVKASFLGKDNEVH